MTLDEFKQSDPGKTLAGLLSDPATIARMVDIARKGRPAVKAIDAEVAMLVGKLSKVERQHVGRLIRDILALQGLRPVRQREWRGGKVFTSGSVYAPIRPPAPMTNEAASAHRDSGAQRRAAALQSLYEGRRNPDRPLTTVDHFIAERRQLWGEPQ